MLNFNVQVKVISWTLLAMLATSASGFWIEDYAGKKLDETWKEEDGNVQTLQKIHHLETDNELLTMSFYYQYEKFSRGDSTLEFNYQTIGKSTDDERVVIDQRKQLEALSALGIKRKVNNGSVKGISVQFKTVNEMALVKELLSSISDRFVLMIPQSLMQELLMSDSDRPIDWLKLKRVAYLRIDHLYITKLSQYVGGWKSRLVTKKGEKE